MCVMCIHRSGVSEGEVLCFSADNKKEDQAKKRTDNPGEKFHRCELLTVAMRSFHVVLHVALLGEADAAHLTLEGLLASVFDHVDLQSALLVEGLVTLSAFERTFACKTMHESNHLGCLESF